MRKWWIYQRERFPLAAHGPLIAAFSSSAVCYTALLAGDTRFPKPAALAVAFVTCLFFFLQLRIADEFKDHEEDRRYRPYRPVPRGLVTLRELGVLFAGTAAIQFLAAWTFEPRLVFVLLGAWIYLALMSVEFFARDWLVARPITYLWTHMLIMPIVDLYATACYWLPTLGEMPAGLTIFLIVSFLNGLTIEIGRKLRRPEDEETGVPTYSRLWGPRRAALVWTTCLALTAVLAVVAAYQIGFTFPVLVVALLLIAGAAMQSCHFHRNLAPGSAKRFEAISGLCTLIVYLMLGLVPMTLRALASP